MFNILHLFDVYHLVISMADTNMCFLFAGNNIYLQDIQKGLFTLYIANG
jgi:hypothetical protein